MTTTEQLIELIKTHPKVERIGRQGQWIGLKLIGNHTIELGWLLDSTDDVRVRSSDGHIRKLNSKPILEAAKARCADLPPEDPIATILHGFQ